jgi:hypothetical protein
MLDGAGLIKYLHLLEVFFLCNNLMQAMKKRMLLLCLRRQSVRHGCCLVFAYNDLVLYYVINASEFYSYSAVRGITAKINENLTFILPFFITATTKTNKTDRFITRRK